MTFITLHTPADCEWVPLWPVSVRRLRVVDPVLFQYVEAAQVCDVEAELKRREADTLRMADVQLSPLLDLIESMAHLGVTNVTQRGELASAAVMGLSIARAEIESLPVRAGFTHPVWHLVLAVREEELLEELGPASILALNAAHRGAIMQIPWPETFDKDS